MPKVSCRLLSSLAFLTYLAPTLTYPGKEFANNHIIILISVVIVMLFKKILLSPALTLSTVICQFSVNTMKGGNLNKCVFYNRDASEPIALVSVNWSLFVCLKGELLLFDHFALCFERF